MLVLGQLFLILLIRSDVLASRISDVTQLLKSIDNGLPWPRTASKDCEWGRRLVVGWRVWRSCGRLTRFQDAGWWAEGDLGMWYCPIASAQFILHSTWPCTLARSSMVHLYSVSQDEEVGRLHNNWHVDIVSCLRPLAAVAPAFSSLPSQV